MELFHGSNVVVSKPCIRPNLRALDFGAGFYLTSDQKQAVRWARNVVRRRKDGQVILNVYEFDVMRIPSKHILKFTKEDGDWLDFVVMNRKESYRGQSYDLVLGPVANDSTLPVINDYMDGVYTKEEAVRRLLPQNLTDQYAFLTEAALQCLIFKGSVSL